MTSWLCDTGKCLNLSVTVSLSKMGIITSQLTGSVQFSRSVVSDSLQPHELQGANLTAPGFLPGESHKQRSLVGYSPWSHKESDMTERLSTIIITDILCWVPIMCQKLAESFGGILSLGSFNNANMLILTPECLQSPNLGTGDTMVNKIDIYSWRGLYSLTRG